MCRGGRHCLSVVLGSVLLGVASGQFGTAGVSYEQAECEPRDNEIIR